jgi:type IV secretory pathway VirB2 component (pilin)
MLTDTIRALLLKAYGYETKVFEFVALDVECQSANAGQCNLVKSNQKLDNQVWRILQVVFGILGGIAVIMIVIGGFMYSVSAGDAGKVKNAKNTILYAVIGLVIALFATAIVSFIASYFT